jgi:transcriptional regulator with XRE-family HTH domain
MLSRESLTTLCSVENLAKVFQEFSEELKDPAVEKRFVGNVFLLMGQYQITISTLAEMSNCSQSTMSRLLAGKSKFEKTRLMTFVGIASALQVDVYTLLFIDLREKFTEILTQRES